VSRRCDLNRADAAMIRRPLGRWVWRAMRTSSVFLVKYYAARGVEGRIIRKEMYLGQRHDHGGLGLLDDDAREQLGKVASEQCVFIVLAHDHNKDSSRSHK